MVSVKQNRLYVDVLKTVYRCFSSIVAGNSGVQNLSAEIAHDLPLLRWATIPLLRSVRAVLCYIFCRYVITSAYSLQLSQYVV